MKENFCILIQILLEFVPVGSIVNVSPMIQIMVWSWTGNKPLTEPVEGILVIIGSVNGLLPVWYQAINWTNDDQSRFHYMGSLGNIEF